MASGQASLQVKVDLSVTPRLKLASAHTTMKMVAGWIGDVVTELEASQGPPRRMVALAMRHCRQTLLEGVRSLEDRDAIEIPRLPCDGNAKLPWERQSPPATPPASPPA
jgi:hypothetical protein